MPARTAPTLAFGSISKGALVWDWVRPEDPGSFEHPPIWKMIHRNKQAVPTRVVISIAYVNVAARQVPEQL